MKKIIKILSGAFVCVPQTTCKAIKISFLLFIIATALPPEALAAGAPPKTPIDGGLSLLLAAGGVYGVKKLKDYRKKES